MDWKNLRIQDKRKGKKTVGFENEKRKLLGMNFAFLLCSLILMVAFKWFAIPFLLFQGYIFLKNFAGKAAGFVIGGMSSTIYPLSVISCVFSVLGARSIQRIYVEK